MNPCRMLCALSAISVGSLVIASDVSKATEFAVLRQRFSQNGITLNSQSGGTITPVERLDIFLNTSRAGALQSASSSLGIVNPDSKGLGDASSFDVFYTGLAGDFPANSFFDIFVDITDPGNGQPGAMQKGTVKFFNEAKGFGFDSSTRLGGTPELLLNSFSSLINPAQTGLSFSDVQIVQSSTADPNANSFFDIFTQLQFDGSGTIDPNQPLFEITMTGNSVPEPSTLILAMVGVAALMARNRNIRLRIA